MSTCWTSKDSYEQASVSFAEKKNTEAAEGNRRFFLVYARSPEESGTFQQRSKPKEPYPMIQITRAGLTGVRSEFMLVASMQE
jgi:hypothetical protein